MPVLRNLDRKAPATPNGRVRNYLANRELGAAVSTIHENIVNPGGVIPWHAHPVEEIIVVLEGSGVYETAEGAEPYGPGDVLIIPAGVDHLLRNAGDVPIKQLCFFPGDSATTWTDKEVYAGH